MIWSKQHDAERYQNKSKLSTFSGRRESVTEMFNNQMRLYLRPVKSTGLSPFRHEASRIRLRDLKLALPDKSCFLHSPIDLDATELHNGDMQLSCILRFRLDLQEIAMKWIFAFISLLWSMSFASSAFAAPLNVFVSITPEKYFVEKVGGPLVDVSIMVPPGASPHNYEPKPKQLIALSNAKIYFAIGVNFEDVWLDKISSANTSMKIVHVEKGIEKIPMAGHHHHDDGEAGGEHESVDHHHGEHGRGALDPHVWTSPVQVKIIARNILEALKNEDPVNAPAYEENYDSFIKELDALDSELRSVFDGARGMKFLVFHPSWGYLAKDYGLEQVAIEIQGKEPKPAQLARIIEHAKEEGIKAIFAQPQMSTKSARTIADAIGARVIMADPLAEDWGANLKTQAELFREALK